MANIKDILNYCKEAATANGYSYRLIRSVSDVNSITANQFPMIAVLPPPTESGYLEKGVHGFTVFVLDKLPMVTQDTTKNTNDRYHAKYKALDDAFYAWHTSLVNSNSGQSLFSNVGSDVTISRLRDGRTNEELLGIQVEFELVTTWYCNGTNPDIPTGGGGSCDPATILNADGSSYTTVASGGTLQLSGVNVAGQTPATGVKNDGTTFTVSGVTVTGQTSATGVKNDGTTFTVSGVTISGNTPATGVQQDGSVFSVSGVTISGNTPATGTQQDGTTFTVSGVTVSDIGGSTTYDDGDSITIYRPKKSINLNGTTQYVNVPYNALFNFGFSDAFSVSLWFSSVSTTTGNALDLVGNQDTSKGWRIRTGLDALSNQGAVSFQFRNSANQIVTNSQSSYWDNQWHHALITYDGSGDVSGVTIYVNGSAVVQQNTTNTANGNPRVSNPLTFGVRPVALDQHWDGNLSHVAIWNVELLASDATRLYNSGCPIDSSGEANIVGFWNLDSDTNDDGANNLNGTAINSPIYTSNRP